MRIIVDYKSSKQEVNPLEVESAKYLSDYVLRIKFTNGVENLVDFKPFILKSMHPSIKKYLNENYFSDFKVINGNINWNDYELIFPIKDLYMNNICSDNTRSRV